MSDAEVQRPGFSSPEQLMAYAYMVEGMPENLPASSRRPTSLSYFEKWLLYAEWIYRKSSRRLVDLAKSYGISKPVALDVFDSILQLVLRSRSTWPRFATFDEDKYLRKLKWTKYDGKRIVFWDNTGIMTEQASTASLQRALYSLYYGGNCTKAGIAVQLCGWLVCEELWVGGISDTEYVIRSRILEKQCEFVDSDCNKTPFTNILDKGYRIAAAARRCGGQIVLQPVFSHSDYIFSAFDVILSSDIAADRAANERGVNTAKRGAVGNSTIKHTENLERTADTWLAWGFQTNFMYSSVV